MKKSLIVLLAAIALILTGCNESSKESFDGLTINQGAAMDLTEGSSERLSLNIQCSETVTPSLTYTSSDVSKVDVDEDGVVYAYATTGDEYVTITVTGTAAVNNEKIEHTASIKIRVVEFATSLEFHDLYWMQAKEDWQGQKYAICRIRYHRGYDDANMHDYELDTLTDMQIGDPANPTALLPQDYEHWVFLKDTVNSQGEKVKKGLFIDSIQSIRSWILSTHCFFDESFQCADQGAIIEYTDYYMYDGHYSYCLGDREFVDDVTEADTILLDGKVAQPYPGYVQIGHFNEEGYLSYFDDAMFQGVEVNWDDYEVWEKYDSYIEPVKAAYDEETGEVGVSMYYLLGYPTGGWFYMESDDNTGWFAINSYEIDAKVYGNALSAYCFKLTTSVDEETGEEYTAFVYPLEMADSQDVTYANGLEEAPRRAARREHVEMPVNNNSIKVRQNVANTMGAIFRMAVLK